MALPWMTGVVVGAEDEEERKLPFAIPSREQVFGADEPEAASSPPPAPAAPTTESPTSLPFAMPSREEIFGAEEREPVEPVQAPEPPVDDSFLGDLKLGAKAIGRGLQKAGADIVPQTLAGSVESLDVPLRDTGFISRTIAKQGEDIKAKSLTEEERKQKVFGVEAGTLESGAESTGYSAAIMGPQYAAQLAGGALGSLVTPGVGTAAGVAAGAGVGYAIASRADMNQVMRQKRDQLLELNPNMTEQEWESVKNEVKDAVKKHGRAEGLWEAGGNALQLGILKVAGKWASAAKGPISKEIARRGAAIAGGAAVDVPIELATEAKTQQAQAAAEREMGLREPGKPLTFGEALGEVGPQTIVTTLLTMGLGGAVSQTGSAIKQHQFVKAKPAAVAAMSASGVRPEIVERAKKAQTYQAYQATINENYADIVADMAVANGFQGVSDKQAADLLARMRAKYPEHRQTQVVGSQDPRDTVRAIVEIQRGLAPGALRRPTATMRPTATAQPPPAKPDPTAGVTYGSEEDQSRRDELVQTPEQFEAEIDRIMAGADAQESPTADSALSPAPAAENAPAGLETPVEAALPTIPPTATPAIAPESPVARPTAAQPSVQVPAAGQPMGQPAAQPPPISAPQAPAVSGPPSGPAPMPASPAAPAGQAVRPPPGTPPADRGAAPISKERAEADRIMANDPEKYRFQDDITPSEINGIWGEAQTIQDERKEANAPERSQIQKELASLKGKRKGPDAQRKKDIQDRLEELDALEAEPMARAEAAYAVAQEELAQRIIAKAKAAGIDVSKIDEDAMYDEISNLSDGRMNESGWNKPLVDQGVELIREMAGEQQPEAKPAAKPPERMSKEMPGYMSKEEALKRHYSEKDRLRYNKDRQDHQKFLKKMDGYKTRRINKLRDSFSDDAIEVRIERGETIGSERELVDAKIGASVKIQERINRALGYRLKDPAYIPELPPGYTREGDLYVFKGEAQGEKPAPPVARMTKNDLLAELRAAGVADRDLRGKDRAALAKYAESVRAGGEVAPEQGGAARLEQKAIEFSNNPANLRKRLMWHLEWAGIKNRAAWKLDAPNKRMVSPNGQDAVVWKTRRHPELPESYENQQTSEGAAEIVKIGETASAPSAQAATTKEPWQMTREEYGQKVADDDAEIRAKDPRHQAYDQSEIDDLYRREIADAIKSGKPVPQDAMADYNPAILSPEAFGLQAPSTFTQSPKAGTYLAGVEERREAETAGLSDGLTDEGRAEFEAEINAKYDDLASPEQAIQKAILARTLVNAELAERTGYGAYLKQLGYRKVNGNFIHTGIKPEAGAVAPAKSEKPKPPAVRPLSEPLDEGLSISVESADGYPRRLTFTKVKYADLTDDQKKTVDRELSRANNSVSVSYGNENLSAAARKDAEKWMAIREGKKTITLETNEHGEGKSQNITTDSPQEAFLAWARREMTGAKMNGAGQVLYEKDKAERAAAEEAKAVKENEVLKEVARLREVGDRMRAEWDAKAKDIKFKRDSVTVEYKDGHTETFNGLSYRHMVVAKSDVKGESAWSLYHKDSTFIAKYATQQEARVAAIRMADLLPVKLERNKEGKVKEFPDAIYKQLRGIANDGYADVGPAFPTITNDEAHPLIGREWDSRHGRQRVKSVERKMNPDHIQYVIVETVGTGAIRKYELNRIEEAIKRDEYEATPEYRTEMDEMDKRIAKIREDAANSAAEKETTAAKIYEYVGTLGFPKLQAGRLAKSLKQTVGRESDGKTYSGKRVDVVRQMLADGYKPEAAQINAVQPMTRTQFNRASAAEQAAHDKRMAMGEKKTEYRLVSPDESYFVVTKAEHDYAVWLAKQQARAQPAEQAEAPSAPQTVAVDLELGSGKPLMLRYANVRKEAGLSGDTVLAIRIGDFYEIFGPDAKRTAEVLGVALTKRQGVEMVGFPYRASDAYVAKLMNAGLKVALGEDAKMSSPYAGKEPWEMTQKEYLAKESKSREFGTSFRVTSEIGRDHSAVVKRAVAEGKPVPAAVLADYPSLAQPAHTVETLREQAKAAGISPVGTKKDLQGRVAKAETPASTEAATPATPIPPKPGELQDFGQKLGGARKDLVQSASKEISDDDLATMTFSEIWPKSEVDAIEDTDLAALATALRNEVPAKPRKGYKVERWVESVKLVRTLMQYANDNGFDATIKRIVAESSKALESFVDKINLLRQLPREHWDRIGKVHNYPNAYHYAEAKAGEDGAAKQFTTTGEKWFKKVPSPEALAEVDGRYVHATSLDELPAAVMEKLGVPAEAAAMQFEIRGRVGSDVKINKKGDPLYRPLKTFTGKDAVSQARAFIDNNRTELMAAWEAVKDSDNVKETDVRRAENRPRTGKDHRQGRPATPEMFTQAFGFRGVEFGNWVSQGKNIRERQGMLDAAYDALMDLADIVGVPARAISLDGTLGLGLGSRGHGWASAHYEPDTLVINLTKTRGAGSLAHEWLHAMDNYFQRMRSTEGMSREKLYITYNPETYYQDKASGARLPAKRFNELLAKGRLNKASDWTRIEGVRPEVEEKFAALVNALDASPMHKRVSLLDKGKSGGYWSRVIERAARSFENYVIAKMQQKGYDNDYLANVVSIERFGRDPGRYPYLLAEELKPIEQAFDDLFGTIKTRETDRGVAMFAAKLDGPATSLGEKLESTAKNQYDRSDGVDSSEYLFQDGTGIAVNDDHRIINTAFGNRGIPSGYYNEPGSSAGYMIAFMGETGAVRTRLSSDGNLQLSFVRQPTREQIRAILNTSAGTVVVDRYSKKYATLASKEFSMPYEAEELQSFLQSGGSTTRFAAQNRLAGSPAESRMEAGYGSKNAKPTGGAVRQANQPDNAQRNADDLRSRERWGRGLGRAQRAEAGVPEGTEIPANFPRQSTVGDSYAKEPTAGMAGREDGGQLPAGAAAGYAGRDALPFGDRDGRQGALPGQEPGGVQAPARLGREIAAAEETASEIARRRTGGYAANFAEAEPAPEYADTPEAQDAAAMLKAHGVERVHVVRGMKSLAVRMPDGSVFLDESLGTGAAGTSLHELVHKWKREANPEVVRLVNAFQRSTAAAKRFVARLADSVESALGNRADAEAYADEHAAEEAGAIMLDLATEGGGRSALGLARADVLAAYGGLSAQAEKLARGLADKAQAAKRAYLAGRAAQAAPTADATDRAYLAAVEAGDTATAQRIVDEAAKRAGYTVGPVFHGTKEEFSRFSKSRIESEDGFFFSSDLQDAKFYGPRIISTYLKIDNPFIGTVHDWSSGSYPDSPEKAAKGGYDGVEIIDQNGEWGKIGMKVWMVYEPSQIKSADAVVRDDAGRIIPPSERFNQKSEDIRYAAARHGSPHTFDKFSMDKIGMNEGAERFVVSSEEDAEYLRLLNEAGEIERNGHGQDGGMSKAESKKYMELRRRARDLFENALENYRLSARESGWMGIDRTARAIERALKKAGIRTSWKKADTGTVYLRVNDSADDLMFVIRVSDHEQPAFGGFSVERQERFGESEIDLNPTTGATWQEVADDALAAANVMGNENASPEEYKAAESRLKDKYKKLKENLTRMVVYGPDGKILSLSQRFNPKNADIRFAAKAAPGTEYDGARVEQYATKSGAVRFKVVVNGKSRQAGFGSAENAERYLTEQKARLKDDYAAVVRRTKASVADIAEARRKLTIELSNEKALASDIINSLFKAMTRLDIMTPVHRKEIAAEIKRTAQERKADPDGWAKRTTEKVWQIASRISYMKELGEIFDKKQPIVTENKTLQAKPKYDAFADRWIAKAKEYANLTPEEVNRRIEAIDADQNNRLANRGEDMAEEIDESVRERHLLSTFGGLYHGADYAKAKAAFEAAKDLVTEGREKFMEIENHRKLVAAAKRQQIIEETKGGRQIDGGELEMETRSKSIWEMLASAGNWLHSKTLSGPYLYNQANDTRRGVADMSGEAVRQYESEVRAIENEEQLGETVREDLTGIMSEAMGLADPANDRAEAAEFSKILHGWRQKQKATGIFLHRAVRNSRGDIVRIEQGSELRNSQTKLLTIFMIAKRAESAAKQKFTNEPIEIEGGFNSIMEALVHNGYTAETVAQIEKNLDPRLIKIGWRMLEYMRDHSRPEVEKATFRLLGAVPPMYGDWYFPMDRANDKRNVAGGRNAYTLVQGFMKMLTPNSLDFRPVDAFERFLSHFDDLNHVVSHIDVVDEQNRIFNHPDMQKALRVYRGDSMRRAVNNHLDRLTLGGEAGMADSTLRWFRSMFARSVIPNPTQTPKQMSSMILFSTRELPPGANIMDWFTGFGKAIASPRDALRFNDELNKYSVRWRERYGHGYNQQVREARRGATARDLLGKRMAWFEFMNAFPQAGDKMSSLLGGRPIYDLWYKHYAEVEKNPPIAAREKAMRKFMDAVELTQQSGALPHLSDSQVGFAANFMMFKTQPTAMTRLWMNSARNLAMKRGTVRDNVWNMVAVMIGQMAFQAAADAFFVAAFDDPDEWKRLRHNQVRAALFAPINGYLVLPEALLRLTKIAMKDKVYGEFAGDVSSYLDVVNDIENVVKMFMKEEEMDGNDWMDVAQGIGSIGGAFTGKPIAPTVRWGRGIYDAVTDPTLSTPGRIARGVGYGEQAAGQDKPRKTSASSSPYPWAQPAYKSPWER